MLFRSANFCTNCGTKIIKDDSFCVNCGTKLKKGDNFCINCGAKIDKSNTKPTKPLIKSVHDSLEKEKNRMAEEKSSKEPKNPIIKKEMPIKKIEKKEIVHGNYCSLNCRYCYEEYFDSGGEITGDFDDEGYTEYYCHLGHPISLGSFCKDYE